MKKKVSFKFILPVIILLIMSAGVGFPLFYNGFFAIAGAVFNPAAGPPSELSKGFHTFALYFIGAIGLISLYISSREIE